jgi:hypothetical protein
MLIASAEWCRLWSRETLSDHVKSYGGARSALRKDRTANSALGGSVGLGQSSASHLEWQVGPSATVCRRCAPIWLSLGKFRTGILWFFSISVCGQGPSGRLTLAWPGALGSRGGSLVGTAGDQPRGQRSVVRCSRGAAGRPAEGHSGRPRPTTGRIRASFASRWLDLSVARRFG